MDFTGVLLMLFLIACTILLAVCTLVTGLFWWLRRRARRSTAAWWRRHCLGAGTSLLMAGIALPVAAAVIERGPYRTTIRSIENDGLFLIWLLPVAFVWWLVARILRAGQR